MEIEIKPDEIDKYVKDAIINSTVGKIISEKVASHMKDIINRSWDNPIDELIKGIIRATIYDLLCSTENTAIIKNAVAEKFSKAWVDQVVNKAIERL